MTIYDEIFSQILVPSAEQKYVHSLLTSMVDRIFVFQATSDETTSALQLQPATFSNENDLFPRNDDDGANGMDGSGDVVMAGSGSHQEQEVSHYNGTILHYSCLP